MSFMKKALGVFGVGGCKIDAIITTDEIVPGGSVEGRVEIMGGEMVQELRDLKLAIYTDYTKESGDSTKTVSVCLNREVLSINRDVQINENISVPFHFILSPHAPITAGRTLIYMESEIDVPRRIDPKDKDYMQVKPNRQMNNVFVALENLGFRIREVENKQSYVGEFGFVQEFEFIPTNGKYKGYLDELEVVFVPRSNGYELLLQVDRKARGLGSLLMESLDMDESNVRVGLNESELASVSEIGNILASTISRYI